MLDEEAEKRLDRKMERSATWRSLRLGCDEKNVHDKKSFMLKNHLKNHKHLHRKANTFIGVCLIFFGSTAAAQTPVTVQKQVIEPNFISSENFKTINRAVAVTKDSHGKAIVHLDGKPGNGIAWINNVTFKTGTIELDIKGKNVLQQSFVGIAFHGVNDSTYDGVYFRPFNFQSPDALRKSHAVQYISMPQYDWSALREKYPGKYEHGLLNTTDPEKWFHAKIVVAADRITVYVNSDRQPSLVVQPISKHTDGNIGFWVGHTSDGDFANLVIRNQ